MADTTPTTPGGWNVSTALPTHLSLRYRGDGRSLLVRPSEPTTAPADPDAVDTWTVKGLAGYDPAYPIFAEGVSRTEAIEAAESVMATITRGDTPSPVRVSTQSESPEGSTTEGSAESSEPPEQAALSTFAADADDE